MEEMREAAMAYYANMSKDQQKTLVSFYKSIDANGNGEVSIQEYLDSLVKKGHNLGLHTNLFKLLDKNDHGTLDFEESVTFFYMLTSNRLVICAGCQSYLWGLHFLCIKCHKVDKEKTYDLCCSCYRNKNFTHAHSCFMDNYALLRNARSMVTYCCSYCPTYI
ncbi:hypothetical protein RHMOL_Rhmol02G0049700 [Rhododendron molle]|uniref:Uncharacterized protein n=1 Tax=Rhododendron molle TaxID=49168 RepID=A0ACC0PN53_RHOML|nr:hypothetical protein RHMOL_Rhmol02G0049700 [Rhododendron molle]